MNIQFQSFTLEFILLFGSTLLVLSVLASRISSSFGVPALIIFLGLGMLAGSEGPGGLPFDNHSLAFAVGSVCLAFILFDGGIRTSWQSVRPILPVGLSLTLFGTFITGAVTGVFTNLVFGLGWHESLLLGAIVSSTDAAAVFSILRAKGLSLRGHLKQTLEFEAGSNDPVAAFLTISMLSLMTAESGGYAGIGLLLAQQAGLGLAVGVGGAKVVRLLLNKVGIEFEGLYGVLMIGLVLVLFSVTSSLGGSGFLAVYVAGLMLGNSNFLHKSSIIKFLDGIAWMSQILIFLVLGLLVFPSKLLLVWKEGLLLALFMMLVARPLSVFVSAQGKLFEWKEKLFVSWIGLRGAAPIILATLPWSMGLPGAEYYFNLVFFIVLISVIVQGISIPWVAEKLKVTVPFQDEQLQSPELGRFFPPGFVSVEVMVVEDGVAKNKRVIDLGLPPGVLFTSLEREDGLLVPQGDTLILPGDKIRGFARESSLENLRNIFGKVRILR